MTRFFGEVGWMPLREKSNVRIAVCAWDALAAIGGKWGTSRDETVRQVLDEYLAFQEDRDPYDRLTHISTVLRYPAAPRWRAILAQSCTNCRHALPLTRYPHTDPHTRRRFAVFCTPER